jgi:Mrp family chromosome partitioning ATPase/predicted Fe-Mo cluster-binding NifX family protein
MTTDQSNTCNDSNCFTQEKRPGEQHDDFVDRQSIQSRMCQIKHKILVLSGKGGVGKSTVAVNLAASLALAGKQVGLLDVDIHGPSIPKLLHLEGTPITSSDNSLHPVNIELGSGAIRVMSIGFLLKEKDDAVIWRGPRKYSLIKQFLKDVEWGSLDYLIVDSPPGTGDEPLAVAELIERADGAVIVTTPQQIAIQDVRRCVVFCRQVNLNVIGVVENMSGFTCPNCKEQVAIFGADGGHIMAKEMNVPYLGGIPIEPEVVLSGDNGIPIVMQHTHSETAKAFGRIVRKLLEPEFKENKKELKSVPKGRSMRIAIPVTNGVLSSHFGHCEKFALYDVIADGKSMGQKQMLTPPPHEPGTFPKWLHEQGATIIIAGGMGSRAQSLFQQNDIEVVVGAPCEDPEKIVKRFLSGQLESGTNVCDH